MNNKKYFFDVVGTLLYPTPSVIDTYQGIGMRFGSKLSKNEITTRFNQAYAENFRSTSYENCITSEKIEMQRWQNVVHSIFGDVSINNSALFEELWNHFAKPKHWAVFDDTNKLLNQLNESDMYVGFASNFDKRILNICKTHFPRINSDRIFYSSKIGFSKPDINFYKSIENELNINNDSKFTMIGDDLINDISAAKNAGWEAIHRDQIPENLIDWNINII